MPPLPRTDWPATTQFGCRAMGDALPRLFPDVPPDVLAREDAHERRLGTLPPGNPRQTCLGRLLPALERQAAGEMAAALLAAGHRPVQALAHASAMRRRAMAAGDGGRVRFWSDVAEALDPDLDSAADRCGVRPPACGLASPPSYQMPSSK